MANVSWNGHFLGTTNNQFSAFAFQLDKHQLEGENSLKVAFDSPVLYAQKKFEEYKVRINPIGSKTLFQANFNASIPPVQTNPTQKGEDHPNFIRKTQSSFSWDWGPAFPTVGFYQSAQIFSFDRFFLDSVSIASSHKGNGKFVLFHI